MDHHGTQVPTVNVHAANDGAAVVLTPLDADSEALLAILLGDLAHHGEWNFNGGVYRTPFVKDLFTGVFIAAGGVMRSVTVDHSTHTVYVGAIDFFLSLSDDTDHASRYRVREFGYYCGWLVSPDSTPGAVRLVANAHCKVCQGPLCDRRELDWKVCSTCSAACPHVYKESLGQYHGNLAWMPICQLCGIGDPAWQPTRDPDEELVALVAEGRVGGLIIRLPDEALLITTGTGAAGLDETKEETQMSDAKPVVLIFEDHPTWQQVFASAVDADSYDVVTADSPAAGRQKFDEVRDRVALVVMDGALGGDDLNSLPLIRYIREAGYTGPMIAASGLSDYRVDMVRAGCDHSEGKDQVPGLVESLLAAA